MSSGCAASTSTACFAATRSARQPRRCRSLLPSGTRSRCSTSSCAGSRSVSTTRTRRAWGLKRSMTCSASPTRFSSPRTSAVLEAERGESDPDEPAPTTPPLGEPLAVAYYQADDSVFVDDAYVVKGVPGRILWKLLREHGVDGRTSFTNRELRLDERLGLPAGNDNLEARLLVLRKRLAALECGITLERVDRGRLSLGVSAPLTLAEVPTTGPMRAAHHP